MIRDAIRAFFKQADIFLLMLCLITSGCGLVLIYSATRYSSTYHSLPMKQAIYIAIGIVVFIVCNYIDLEILLEKWRAIVVIATGLIVLLLRTLCVNI